MKLLFSMFLACAFFTSFSNASHEFYGVTLGESVEKIKNIENYTVSSSYKLKGDIVFDQLYSSDNDIDAIIEISTINGIVESVMIKKYFVKGDEIDSIVLGMIKVFGTPKRDGRKGKNLEDFKYLSVQFNEQDDIFYKIYIDFARWGNNADKIYSSKSITTKKFQTLMKEVQERFLNE